MKILKCSMRIRLWSKIFKHFLLKFQVMCNTTCGKRLIQRGGTSYLNQVPLSPQQTISDYCLYLFIQLWKLLSRTYSRFINMPHPHKHTHSLTHIDKHTHSLTHSHAYTQTHSLTHTGKCIKSQCPGRTIGTFDFTCRSGTLNPYFPATNQDFEK